MDFHMDLILESNSLFVFESAAIALESEFNLDGEIAFLAAYTTVIPKALHWRLHMTKAGRVKRGLPFFSLKGITP